ncbi:MAG: flagellar basal-body rod protein FlgG [Verrucomicrobiota bacterium]
MIRALWASANGMTGQQTNVDIIANNLANVNTSGFKAKSLQFEDLMYQTERAPGGTLADGSNTPTGLQVGYGSRPIASVTSFSPGDLKSTGAPLDVAIEGKGFFRVTLPDGTFGYTRDGQFTLNAEGLMVTTTGYQLDGVGQIDTNATDVSIGKSGSLSVVVDGAIQALAPITLATFPNPEGLRSAGNNLFLETEASGAATTGITPGEQGTGTIAQGFLEGSNVRVVEEMVRLIQAQRAYEINSKSIQSSDEMLSLVNSLKR